jgi:hypothetical protein
MEKGLKDWQQFWKDERKKGINHIAIAYQNAWQKLTKYYRLTDLAHGIYAAAVLLHPSHRRHYFDARWKGEEEEWKPVMIENVKKIWREEYRSISTDAVQAQPPPNIIDAFIRQTYTTSDEQDDDFDAYIKGPCINFTSPDQVMPWVIDNTHIPASVRQHILDLLSIPAMSAELERVFSHAKLTITPRRSSLAPGTVEKLELLRHWWTNDVITQERGSGVRSERRRKLWNVLDDNDIEDDDIYA